MEAEAVLEGGYGGRVGRMGRIDEDKAYAFNEVDLNNKSWFHILDELTQEEIIQDTTGHGISDHKQRNSPLDQQVRQPIVKDKNNGKAQLGPQQLVDLDILPQIQKLRARSETMEVEDTDANGKFLLANEEFTFDDMEGQLTQTSPSFELGALRDFEPHVAIEQIRFQVDEACRMSKFDPKNIIEAIHVGWTKPEAGIFKINVDGGMRTTDTGSKHTASIGGVIRDNKGNWICGFAEQIETESPLGAELSAIRRGHELAWATGLVSVIVESDSREALESINSGTSSHHYFNTILQIRQKMDLPWQVALKHVWREGNKVADALSQTWFRRKYHAG
ncbi:hypothetical protein BUALT_Bualt15G0052000 [Buddleja alternifolia]|uniref:RNase H type-1 domain-containing protein n=1 Tax=Buddleja alternifolia TaxID=168488 RepID=A0AAV6WEI3_9LAMI|nr:hypothetical protein BUALT_Bualt15G0052000 [Buddleja alternifolia]